MFGSDYDRQFGIPPFPFIQMDPQGGLFGGGAVGGAAGGFVGLEHGQPTPGVSPPGASLATPGAGAGAPAMRSSAPDVSLPASASPSVAALQSGNPLAAGRGGSLGVVGGNGLAAGAGAAPSSFGAGAPAMTFTGRGA